MVGVHYCCFKVFLSTPPFQLTSIRMQWNRSVEGVAAGMTRYDCVCAVDGTLYKFSCPTFDSPYSTPPYSISVSVLNKDLDSWTDMAGSPHSISVSILNKDLTSLIDMAGPPRDISHLQNDSDLMKELNSWTTAELARNIYRFGLPTELRCSIDHLRAISYGEDVYILARIDCPGFEWAGIYCYNTRTGKWSHPEVRGKRPEVSFGFSCCIVGDSIYLFVSMPRYAIKVHRLDLQTMTWSLLGGGGRAKVYAFFNLYSTTAIEDRIYVFGVYDKNREWSNDLHYFDIVTHSWHLVRVCGEDLPEERSGHAAINLRGKLVIFGGRRCQRIFLNDLWMFDPSTLTWTQERPMGIGPTPRDLPAICHLGSKIVVLSGHTFPSCGFPRVYHNDLFVLDLNPRLRVLCISTILKSGISTENLPPPLQREIERKRD